MRWVRLRPHLEAEAVEAIAEDPNIMSLRFRLEMVSVKFAVVYYIRPFWSFCYLLISMTCLQQSTSTATKRQRLLTETIQKLQRVSRYFLLSLFVHTILNLINHKFANCFSNLFPFAGEWEGASLRNSRVNCNVIVPLVSSKSSKVPLVALETALADYNVVVAHTLGSRPASVLWTSLHDMRFLLLRMAYGEALNADCGGGSSSSNFVLLLYQMCSADVFATNAEHDESVAVSRHARGLSTGFLVGADVVDGPEFCRHDSRSKRLERGVAGEKELYCVVLTVFLVSY